MTKLLEEAIAKLKTLSDEQQDRVAELLLHLAEGEAEIELTDEQIEGIEIAMQQADRGEFATEEQVKAAFGRSFEDGKRWIAENRSAIDAYNKRVAEGVILSDLDRAF